MHVAAVVGANVDCGAYRVAAAEELEQVQFDFAVAAGELGFAPKSSRGCEEPAQRLPRLAVAIADLTTVRLRPVPELRTRQDRLLAA